MHNLIKKTISAVLLMLVAVSASAQDLIAKQAPSDKRMKDVNNVKLRHVATMAAADLDNPASNIYSDWNNDRISNIAGSVPANYKIDLRGFCMPTPSRRINSPFGPRWGKQHEGLDLKVYIGDTIKAAFDGKVRIVKYNAKGYGYYVVIRHPNGLETLYGHLSKQLVKPDQIVRAGQAIGLGGNTGKSSGSHLHFETRLLGKALNPAYMFDFERQDVTGDFYTVGPESYKKGSVASRTAARIEDENSALAANVGDNENAKNGNATAAAQPSQKKAQIQASTSHSVKKGDTLYSIARKYGTTVDKLCKLNGIKENTVLRLGQKLRCS